MHLLTNNMFSLQDRCLLVLSRTVVSLGDLPIDQDIMAIGLARLRLVIDLVIEGVPNYAATSANYHVSADGAYETLMKILDTRGVTYGEETINTILISYIFYTHFSTIIQKTTEELEKLIGSAAFAQNESIIKTLFQLGIRYAPSPTIVGYSTQIPSYLFFGSHYTKLPVLWAALQGSSSKRDPMTKPLSQEFFMSLMEHDDQLVDRGTGRTALHFATLEGEVDIVEQIIKSGMVDIDAQDETGAAIHHAVLGGNHEVFDFLVANGANIHLISPNSFTILHMAVYNQDPSFVRKILDLKDIDVNARGGPALNKTALELAQSLSAGREDNAPQKLICDFLTTLLKDRALREECLLVY